MNSLQYRLDTVLYEFYKPDVHKLNCIKPKIPFLCYLSGCGQLYDRNFPIFVRGWAKKETSFSFIFWEDKKEEVFDVFYLYSYTTEDAPSTRLAWTLYILIDKETGEIPTTKPIF